MAKYKNIVNPAVNMNLTEAVKFGKQILKDNNVTKGNLRYNGLLIPFSIYSCYTDMEDKLNLMMKLSAAIAA